MMKRIAFAFVLMLVAKLTFGQGVMISPVPALKVNSNGTTSPIAFATITVCAANNASTPCSPALANAIFKDSALTQPLTNPFTADANGNYQFAIASGQYTITVTASNVTGYSYQISATCPPSTSCTWTGSQSFTGNLTVTGNFTVNGGQNSLNFFKHNQVVWVDDAKYTTLAGSLGDVQCASNNCEDDVNSNHSETLTATTSLGTATNSVSTLVHGFPGAKFTCNMTGGGTGCFQLLGGGQISGEAIGAASGGAPSGFMFTVPSTANMTCLFCTNNAQSGGTSYVKLENLFASVSSSATLASVADLGGVNNLPVFSNFYFAGFPSIGMNVHSTAAGGGVAGPMLFTNDWMDGFYNTNAQPWVFQVNTASLFGINVQSGVANHPGSGKTIMSFNGNSTNGLSGVNVTGTFFENLNNGSSIALKFADTQAASVNAVPFSIRDTDTAVDISQTAAGRTCGVQLHAIHQGSPTNAATDISNHISGFTATGFVNVPFYNYGGDSTCSAMPFTVDSNEVDFYDRANHLSYRFPIGGNPVFRNFQDIAQLFALDSGATAAQQTVILFQDRNTVEWQVGKQSNQTFVFQDAINSFKTHIQLTQTATTPEVSFFRLGGKLGTTETTGQVATLSAGWGTTATVSAASGNDTDWSFTISSTGTGQAANPTAVFTFKDGAWVNSPICTATRADVNAPAAATWTLTAAGTTTITLNFIGTPVAATAYTINGHCGAR